MDEPLPKNLRSIGGFISVTQFQVAKVIDARRSQAVGILLSTTRLDMSEIEHGESNDLVSKWRS